MQCFSSTYNIASASAFYPSRPQKKIRKTIRILHVRKSAGPQIRKSAFYRRPSSHGRLLTPRLDLADNLLSLSSFILTLCCFFGADRMMVNVPNRGMSWKRLLELELELDASVDPSHPTDDNAEES